MRFLLLGHFEVQQPDGGPLALTRAKQRMLLALLLLDSPHVVSTAQCIGALWDEEPPPSARRNLQTYIAGLRKALAPSGVLIETVPGGYRITDIDDRLDVAVFALLRSHAGNSLRTGDDAGAVPMFGQALDLWRGPALQDLADGSDALRNAAVHLNEQRAAAVRDLAGAYIRLGAFEEAITQLRAAISRDPLREDLHAQIMMAFHKSGRRAEALLAYHDCRAALMEQIGVGPSRTLTLLQNRILLDDSSL